MFIQAQNPDKHRLIVLTDIEADPDDTQTLIRLLLYSNQIEIEGLIATTSVHQKVRVAPETMKHSGDGGKIFRMILQPARIGVQNHMRRQITLLLQ